MARFTPVVLFAITLAGCECGAPDLVRTSEPVTLAASVDGGAARVDAGTPSKPSDTTTNPPVNGAGFCASDCDCGAGERCISTGSELSTNICKTGGTNSCTSLCTGGCPRGQQCISGTCTLPPCVGTNCTSSYPVSIQGTYATYYELDIHEFASTAGKVLTLLQLLGAALNGDGAQCRTQSTPEGKLMCYVVNLIAQNLHAPPWVGQLITVLSDAFRFGNKPVRIKGTMQLAEGANARLYAAETWSEMWLDYNGQSLNVMNSPELGANGKVTVTVSAFGGTRTATDVSLGPRSAEFDVNKLIVNMLGVVISAASNNRAHDVGGLMGLVLCNNLPIAQAYLCQSAADEFAKNFELDSGLGGVSFSQQRAVIHDLDSNKVADALGLPNARGHVAGEMSNGFISGAFGNFPASSWYGTK